MTADGSVVYSEVRLFLQRKSKVISTFLSITTLNKTITLSDEHLIYSRKVDSPKFNPVLVYYINIISILLLHQHLSLIYYQYLVTSLLCNTNIIFSVSYAADVSIGDEILVELNNRLTTSCVINITISKYQGNNLEL